VESVIIESREKDQQRLLICIGDGQYSGFVILGGEAVCLDSSITAGFTQYQFLKLDDGWQPTSSPQNYQETTDQLLVTTCSNTHQQ
jgi:hypothetical protein